MSDRLIEHQLESVGKQIPVNGELKAQLRSRFSEVALPRRRRKRPAAFFAAAAAALLAVFIGAFQLMSSTQVVAAASLQVIEQYSFLDLTRGDHGTPAVHGETIYLPIYGRGVFRLDSTAVRSGAGLILVVAQPDIAAIALSPDGEKIAYVTPVGLHLVDLSTGDNVLVKETGSQDERFHAPSWSPTGESLVVTRAIGNTQDILYIDLSSGESQQLTSGANASFSPEGNLLIFERDDGIYVRALSRRAYRGLREGQELRLGSGRFPSISPDGRLVAFVSDSMEQTTMTGALRNVNVANVYVASLHDFSDVKKLTANYPIESLQVGQELRGQYAYSQPVWGNDGTSLFVLKSASESGGSSLMCIALSSEPLSPTDLLSRWQEALINGDLDYARSLLVAQAELSLDRSGPQPIGFTITDSGQENRREFVEVRQFLALYGQPYFEVLEQRIYLSRQGNGWLIEEIVTRAQRKIYARGAAFYIEEEADARQLLSLDEVGASLTPQERLGAITYDTAASTLFFSVEDASETSIYAYNDETGLRYVFATSGLSHLSISNEQADGQYLLLNLHQDVRLFSLVDNHPVMTLGRAARAFWSGDQLVLYTDNSDQLVRWQYNPQTGESLIRP